MEWFWLHLAMGWPGPWPSRWKLEEAGGREEQEKEGAEEGGVEGEEGPTWKTESGFECPAYAAYGTVCKASLARLSLYSAAPQAQGIAPVSSRAEWRRRS